MCVLCCRRGRPVRRVPQVHARSPACPHWHCPPLLHTAPHRLPHLCNAAQHRLEAGAAVGVAGREVGACAAGGEGRCGRACGWVLVAASQEGRQSRQRCRGPRPSPSPSSAEPAQHSTHSTAQQGQSAPPKNGSNEGVRKQLMGQPPPPCAQDSFNSAGRLALSEQSGGACPNAVPGPPAPWLAGCSPASRPLTCVA